MDNSAIIVCNVIYKRAQCLAHLPNVVLFFGIPYILNYGSARIMWFSFSEIRE